ncbi:uncharacterized protein PpBr36_10018, partial [Pyricularia pennisetigena]|uniref:uncharacterized protein n=1 Tax=Pyricularia pennisetigena TaxID=1578925 RepID=UPI00114F6241
CTYLQAERDHNVLDIHVFRERQADCGPTSKRPSRAARHRNGRANNRLGYTASVFREGEARDG